MVNSIKCINMKRLVVVFLCFLIFNLNQTFANSNKTLFEKEVIKVEIKVVPKVPIRVPIHLTFLTPSGFVFAIDGYLDVTLTWDGKNPKITVGQFHGLVCVQGYNICSMFRATTIVHANNDVTSMSYTVDSGNQDLINGLNSNECLLAIKNFVINGN
jgi:hypothetical protein